MSSHHISSHNLPYEKVGKNEPVCIADEVPFDIPDSWEWCRLGDLFHTIMGQSPSGDTVSEHGNGMEFHQGKICFGDRYLKPSSQTTTAPTKVAPANSVLLCVRAPVGKVNITDREICIGRGLCSVVPLGGISVNFAYILLETYEDIFTKQATGTTFIAITGEVVKNQLVPVPPLAEQIRIINKIEKISSFVYEYGVKENQLSILNNTFPDSLKKSILQQAVMGKLVPQDPKDEPASILLEKIRAEKDALIKAGKLKKDKHESIIYRRDNSHYEKLDGVERCIDDEILFEIPDSWAWVRFGNVINLQSGQDLTPDKYNDKCKGIPYITGASNIEDATVLINRWTEYGRAFAYRGDLLLTCKGTVGTMAFLSEDKVHIARQIMSIHPYNGIDSKYVRIVLETLVEGLKAAAKSMIPGISREDVLKALFPLPPLNEQRRISEMIEVVSDPIGNL